MARLVTHRWLWMTCLRSWSVWLRLVSDNPGLPSIKFCIFHYSVCIGDTEHQKKMFDISGWAWGRGEANGCGIAEEQFGRWNCRWHELYWAGGWFKRTDGTTRYVQNQIQVLVTRPNLCDAKRQFLARIETYFHIFDAVLLLLQFLSNAPNMSLNTNTLISIPYRITHERS